MPRLTPVSRREFIRRLRALGFTGPHVGGRHQFLLKGERVLGPVSRRARPNPHRGDISVALLTRLLRQAGITRDEWQASA